MAGPFDKIKKIAMEQCANPAKGFFETFVFICFLVPWDSLCFPLSVLRFLMIIYERYHCKLTCQRKKSQCGTTANGGGIKASWFWDGARLVARNDRYGFSPLFYFEHEGEFCISPSLVKLVEQDAPLEFDDPGMAVFLRLGFFIGEDTP